MIECMCVYILEGWFSILGSHILVQLSVCRYGQANMDGSYCGVPVVVFEVLLVCVLCDLTGCQTLPILSLYYFSLEN